MPSGTILRGTRIDMGSDSVESPWSSVATAVTVCDPAGKSCHSKTKSAPDCVPVPIAYPSRKKVTSVTEPSSSTRAVIFKASRNTPVNPSDGLVIETLGGSFGSASVVAETVSLSELSRPPPLTALN